MEHAIAGGILLALGQLVLLGLALWLIIGAIDYFFDHAWIRWTIVGLVGAVAYVSFENMWGYLWDHAYLLIAVPFTLVMIVGIPLALWEGLQNTTAFLARLRGKQTVAARWAPNRLRRFEVKALGNVFGFVRNRLGRLERRNPLASRRIFHQKFGNGVVILAEGNKLLVCFDRVSELKRVVDSFVEPICESDPAARTI